DRDAVPAGRVEDGHARRYPHLPAAGRKPQAYPAVPVVAQQLVLADRVRHVACLARNIEIHAAPQSSWPSRRSAALTASTICAVRASMIALVSPRVIAIGRNAAPIACRAGIPKDTFEAPSVMLTPNSFLIISMVSRVLTTSDVSAPTGMA